MSAPKVNPDTHLSNPLPNVVEVEAAIFRQTDVIADVHHLPFVDCSFSAMIALNAFEHYRDPRQAARAALRGRLSAEAADAFLAIAVRTHRVFVARSRGATRQ